MTLENEQVAVENPRLSAFGAGFLAMDVVEGIETTFATAGGTCGNVMALLSWLGWDSFPVARLGLDEPGDFVLEDLRFDGVKTNFVTQEKSVSTPVVVQKFKVDAKGHRSHRYVLTCPDCGGWLPRFRPTTIRQVQPIIDTSVSPSVFFFDRVSPSALKLASWVREHGGLVVFEPSSIGDENQFRKATSFCHILKFAEDRLGHLDDIRNLTDPDLIIQTHGSRGLEFRFGDTWFEMAAFEAPHFLDAAGSGDWCTAVLLAELGKKGMLAPEQWKADELVSALNKGQAASAINCGFEGARGAMYATEKSALFAAIGSLTGGCDVSIERLVETKPEPRVKLCSLCIVPSFDEKDVADSA